LDAAFPPLFPAYRAPAWLPGGHPQTVWPFLLHALGNGAPGVALRRERWERADGDFSDLDWLDGPADAPLVVLFHGLEGSARSHYAVSLMARLRTRGWRGVVAHFRGCSGAPNRLPRAYHAGDSAEVAALLERARHAAGAAPLHAVGVSLGGNALLKWLGESGPTAAALVDRAAAVSPPVDLAAAGRCLDRGGNRLYTAHFLRSLKAKARRMRAAFPGLLDNVDLDGIRTLHDYDDRVTAPLHGFAGVEDYWARCASKPFLKGIALPTLIVHARNDPFLPATAMAGPQDVSAAIRLDYPEEGGHAGFLAGPFPGRLDWLPERLLAFLADAI
jgi:hypothetical protein